MDDIKEKDSINPRANIDPKDDPEQNAYIAEKTPGWKTLVIKDREKFNKDSMDFSAKRREETKIEGMRSTERFIYLISRDIDNFNKTERTFL